MTTQEAVEHFGGRQAAVAAALAITPSAVSQWGGYPPRIQQLELERITSGALKAEPKAKRHG